MNTSFYCTSQILHLLQIAISVKVWGNLQASLLVPFFQQHLLTACLCVTYCEFSQHFKLFHYYEICFGDL